MNVMLRDITFSNVYMLQWYTINYVLPDLLQSLVSSTVHCKLLTAEYIK